MKIIVLTKSKKWHNYCVAGKDVERGGWVRLTSNDRFIHNAIPTDSFCYKDTGKEIMVGDIISVDVYKPAHYDITQPENCLVKGDNYKNEGRYKGDFTELEDCSRTIFYNNYGRISHEDLIKERDINSLLLIKADIVKLKYNKEKEKIYANIKYKGTWYNNIAVTDTEFNEKYGLNIKESGENGRYLNNIHIVISLGEEYNGYHYKLVASVLI